MEYDYTYDVIEKILLKRSLIDKKYLNIMSNVFDIRWFDKDRNCGILLKLAIAYYKKYENIPSNKILQALIKKHCEKNPSDSLNDLNSELMNINSFDVTVDDDAANKNIEKFIKEKAFYFSVSDNVQEIVKTGNVEKCLARFDKVTKISFQDDDMGMTYFNKEDMDKHWEYITNPEAKLSTGWDGLDRYTNGGFLKDGRMLACFMGQAGLGKSLFLSNITTNFLKQNKTVVVISLEMSQNVYATRFDAHISNQNINKLKYVHQTARANIENFYKEHPNANLFIKEYPPRTVKVSDIEVYLDKLIENGHKFDAVVIDYLNLVLPNEKTDNMYQGILSVTEKLRSLSYKYLCPVVTATQATTQGMNNENIGMEHVSESRGIAHTVDFLGGLYQMDEDRENGIINMRVIKNRLGGNVGKVIPFRMDPYSLTLTDMTFSDNSGTSVSEADQITANLSNISDDINNL